MARENQSDFSTLDSEFPELTPKFTSKRCITPENGSETPSKIARKDDEETVAEMAKDLLGEQRSDIDTTQAGCCPEPIVNVNIDDAVCSFCCDELVAGTGIMLQTCLHVFCKNCLTTAVEFSVETQKTSVKIDCLLSQETSCNGHLLDKEIKSVVSEESYLEYVELGFRLATESLENICHCKTVHCPGLCQYEDGRRIFDCPYCARTNCIPCDGQHEGLSCEEYQDLMDVALDKGETLDSAQKIVENEIQKNGWSQLHGTFTNLVDNVYGKEISTDLVLEDIAERDLLLTTKEFECSICFRDVAVGSGVILQDCLHTFCRDCLVQLIRNSEESVVKCPYVKDYHCCECTLQPREIKALLPNELHDAFLSRSIKQAEGAMTNTFHCKTNDCNGWCELVGGEEYGVFTCDICKKQNCIKCQVCHENITCEDYKNRLVQNKNELKTESKLKEMFDKGLVMHCPNCKIIVEKISGCDSVICTVCKTQICWATKGPRWGPGGRFDNSGGCRCGFNGKRCSPNCRGCH